MRRILALLVIFVLAGCSGSASPVSSAPTSPTPVEVPSPAGSRAATATASPTASPNVVTPSPRPTPIVLPTATPSPAPTPFDAAGRIYIGSLQGSTQGSVYVVWSRGDEGLLFGYLALVSSPGPCKLFSLSHAAFIDEVNGTFEPFSERIEKPDGTKLGTLTVTVTKLTATTLEGTWQVQRAGCDTGRDRLTARYAGGCDALRRIPRDWRDSFRQALGTSC